MRLFAFLLVENPIRFSSRKKRTKTKKKRKSKPAEPFEGLKFGAFQVVATLALGYKGDVELAMVSPTMSSILEGRDVTICNLVCFYLRQ